LQRFNDLFAFQQRLRLLADFLDFADLAIKLGDFLIEENIARLLCRLARSNHAMPEDDGEHSRRDGNAEQEIELATPCGTRKFTVRE
jgi:hypothetical protein